MKATKKQIERIEVLADMAGYTGDAGYNAAKDLLGDGRGWSADIETASNLIDALHEKIGGILGYDEDEGWYWLSLDRSEQSEEFFDSRDEAIEEFKNGIEWM